MFKQWRKKSHPFSSHLFLSSIGSMSQPLLPGCPRPSAKIKGGQGEDGERFEFGGGGLGAVDAGRQAEQNQSNAQ